MFVAVLSLMSIIFSSSSETAYVVPAGASQSIAGAAILVGALERYAVLQIEASGFELA